MADHDCIYCAKRLPTGTEEAWHQECWQRDYLRQREEREKRSEKRKGGSVPGYWTWVPKEKRRPKG